MGSCSTTNQRGSPQRPQASSTHSSLDSTPSWTHHLNSHVFAFRAVRDASANGREASSLYAHVPHPRPIRVNRVRLCHKNMLYTERKPLAYKNTYTHTCVAAARRTQRSLPVAFPSKVRTMTCRLFSENRRPCWRLYLVVQTPRRCSSACWESRGQRRRTRGLDELRLG